jgi:transcriptional regulator with XRE-family HTH domain
MYEYYAKIRDSKGLKDLDVSKGTGIAPGTLSDWKSGRIKHLKAEKLRLIADFFDVSVDYLLTGQHPEQTSTSGKSYYFSDETAKKAQALFAKPGLRILFDAAEDATPEELQLAADILTQFKEARNG